MGNILAIVGRPNVGKSTLFNRLIERRDAIVDAVSGVTRDRNYGKSYWIGVDFSVIDTGGYVMGSEDVFEEEICRQVELAIDEANVLLFLVDVVDGITEMDREVAELLRRSNKKVFLAVNKVDSGNRLHDAAVFYELGLGDYFPISSINGSGTGELLDAVVKEFTDEPLEPAPELPRFSVVGRPNVGKSSLINALLGENRHIVTSVAGTTRDSIYTEYNKFGLNFMLVDTAGLRKKGKVYEDLEFYSVMRSIRAIENTDVVILLIDATQGFEAQDMNIFRLAERNNKGVIVCVNKWDLVDKKDANSHIKFEADIKAQLAPFTDVPILFISALNKQRIHKTLETAFEVYKNRSKHIPTHQLNEIMLPLISENQPPIHKGKRVKIKYVTQLHTHYPQFAFFCNLPQYVKDPYMRFLENRLRENFDFSGVPIKIYFREK
jgi:GTPase